MASCALQRVFRGHLGRRAAHARRMRLYNRLRAARKRRCQAKRRAAATAIQSAYRGHTTRRRFAVSKARALKVRMWRRWRWCLHVGRQRRWRSATAIQAAWRGCQVRVTTTCVAWLGLAGGDAAPTIVLSPSNHHGVRVTSTCWNVSRPVLREHRRMRRAATIIQSRVARPFLARTALPQLVDRQRAAWEQRYRSRADLVLHAMYIADQLLLAEIYGMPAWCGGHHTRALSRGTNVWQASRCAVVSRLRTSRSGLLVVKAVPSPSATSGAGPTSIAPCNHPNTPALEPPGALRHASCAPPSSLDDIGCWRGWLAAVVHEVATYGCLVVMKPRGCTLQWAWQHRHDQAERCVTCSMTWRVACDPQSDQRQGV